jgi:predicted adenylyl cyclase CyaB
VEPRRNVELKCRCADLEAVRRRADALGARDAGLLVQRDTFFTGPRARLKLRELQGPEGARAELISYERPDLKRARTSRYRIAPVDDPDALAAVLAHALGEAGTVSKRRRLYLLRSTRIHLDEVEGLGSFVELETVLAEGRPEADGHAELAELAAALGLDGEERIAVPYVELLRVARVG